MINAFFEKCLGFLRPNAIELISKEVRRKIRTEDPIKVVDRAAFYSFVMDKYSATMNVKNSGAVFTVDIIHNGYVVAKFKTFPEAMLGYADFISCKRSVFERIADAYLKN